MDDANNPIDIGLLPITGNFSDPEAIQRIVNRWLAIKYHPFRIDCKLRKGLPKKFMGREFDGVHRTTFVIDENGVIEDIIQKVKTKEHAAQILK